MKRTAHLFALVVAICATLAPSAVVSEQYGAFTYASDGTAITIKRYQCSTENAVAVIPDTINGLPVTTIGNRSFQNCDALISITIPDSVTSISSMTFYSCDALTNVTIGSSVSSIGYWTFARCAALTSIHVAAKNRVYSDLDGVLYNRDKTVLVTYPTGRAGSYAIPSSVTNVEDNAFFTCDALTSVVIGSRVTNIGRRAFSHCGNLTRVTIPGSVINISDTAFIDCDNLSRVYVAGDELTFEVSVFLSSRPTIYYLTGTLGWDESYWDRRIALWSLPGWSDSSASSSTDRPPIANLAGTTHAEGVMDAYARWVHPVWYDVGTGTRVGEADPHTGTARQCRENLRKIFRAIDQYASEHAKLAGDEIEAQEFAGFGPYIAGGARRLICPGGGEYSPIIVNQVPRCSLEAHTLR